LKKIQKFTPCLGALVANLCFGYTSGFFRARNFDLFRTTQNVTLCLGDLVANLALVACPKNIAFSVGIFSGFCGIVYIPQTQKEVLQK
jgi:hypothetical protein